ncbi:MAG: AI-2E family transporter [Candidatus Dormibacteria bacterium]
MADTAAESGPNRPDELRERAHAEDALDQNQRARAEEDRQQDHTLRAGFWRWGRYAFILIAIFVVVQLLHLIQGVVDGVLSVLLYLLFGGILALILVPLDRLLRKALPQGVSALICILTTIVVVGGIGYALSVPTVQQAQELSKSLPRLQQPFQQAQQFLASHGINISLGSIEQTLGIQTSGASLSNTVVHAASFTVVLAIDIFITLVTTFWLLRDRIALRRGLLAVLPARWRVEVQFWLDAFVTVFGGYIRGQLVLAALVGLLAYAGCTLIGVPFSLLVGFAAGVFELIPLAGAFIGGAVGVLFAFTVSPTLALETIGIFIGIHIIEGYFVAPRVQGRFVRLHALISLLALLAGVYAGGFLGAFFAVPAASLLAVFARAHIADLHANEPQLFTMDSQDRETFVRRRELLNEYGLGLRDKLRRLGRRVLRRDADERTG